MDAQERREFEQRGAALGMGDMAGSADRREFEHAFSAADAAEAAASGASGDQPAAASSSSSSSSGDVSLPLYSPYIPTSLVSHSTFDVDVRRPLVDIPRGLGFSSERGFGGGGGHAFPPSHDHASETESEVDDDDFDDDSQPLHHVHVQGFASSGRLLHAAPNGDPVESGRNGRHGLSGSHRSFLSSSSAGSGTPSPQLYSQGHTPTPSSALLGGDGFSPFTPQSRRNYLQRKIDLVKLQNARARGPNFLWIRGLKNPFTRRRVALGMALTMLTIATTVELVLRKIVAGNMYHYRWLLVEFTALAAFILLALSSLVWHRKSIRHYIRHHGVPIKFLLISSLFESVHALALLLAVGVLPAQWSPVVSQLVVPFALLLRFFVTNGERCDRTGLFGALLVVVGAAAMVTPDLTGFIPCVASHGQSADASRIELVVNLLVLCVGLVASAIATIYKQHHLQHHAINATLMNLLLSGMQAIWCILLSPVALLLQTQGSSGVIGLKTGAGPNTALADPIASDVASFTSEATKDVWANVAAGWACLQGRNTLEGDRCEALFPTLPIAVGVLFLAMLVTPFLITFIMRRTSSERVLATPIGLGVALALVSFEFITPISLLPSWDLTRCLAPWGTISIAAVFAVIIGSIVAQWRPSQEPLDLNVWARLDEIIDQEQIELRRRQRIQQEKLAARTAIRAAAEAKQLVRQAQQQQQAQQQPQPQPQRSTASSQA